MKTLCSLYGCALRVVAVADCDGVVDSITVLLLDILSAVQDAARRESVLERHESSADDSHSAWSGVVRQLTDAQSEAERRASRDLAAVTRKLAQMRETACELPPSSLVTGILENRDRSKTAEIINPAAR